MIIRSFTRAVGCAMMLAMSVLGCASSSTASSTTSPGSAAAASRGDLGVADTRLGTGARAATHKCLYVHYDGTLADGRVFESSRTATSGGPPPSPIVFELGTGMVIAGWERGLVDMQAGGTRRLFVPFRLAYGAGGRPPSIPPRTDLVFDIELLAVATPLTAASNAPRDDNARTCPSWQSVSRAR